MRNSPGLPLVSLVSAVILTIIVLFTHGINTDHLSELEIGAVAGALGLFIYSVQGLISVILEGEELTPGIKPPHESPLLTDAIIALATLLLICALTLAYGIADDWGAIAIGAIAGAGSIIISLIMALYKEAFLGQEVRFDKREDGVPW